MNTGMLWFDNDPKTDLSNKIHQAAAYYQKKYGCWPNLCFVHPSVLKENEAKPRNMEIQPSALIQPNHLWLGVNDSGASQGIFPAG